MSNTYKSTDGETWVKCANHVACNAMTYGAGKFVSVHIESGAYSTDNGETGLTCQLPVALIIGSE